MKPRYAAAALTGVATATRRTGTPGKERRLTTVFLLSADDLTRLSVEAAGPPLRVGIIDGHEADVIVCPRSGCVASGSDFCAVPRPSG